MSEPRADEVVVRHRVIYGDTDAMGVVYYGTYLRFLEIGRAELLRARGKSYREVEEQGYLFPVAEVKVRYTAPARYDDLLEIATRVGEVTRASVRFDYRITRAADGLAIAEGHTVHPCLSLETRRVIRLPPELVTLLRGG